MTFSLTNELLEQIINAMENQDFTFVLDAKNVSLISIEKNDNKNFSNLNVKVDEQIFFSLPEWNSNHGFMLRENFVNNLHSPQVQKQLQNVLHSGRGVFKNFRTVLKNYPEIDKRWHIFKHKVLSARVNEWYNSLREIWGLEKLDLLDESEESLIYDDFSFLEYDSERDFSSVLFNICQDFNVEEKLPTDVNTMIKSLWQNQMEQANKIGQIGFICNTLSDEFAGCITSCSILQNQKHVSVITSFFVSEQYRGLGIATELLSLCISKLSTEKKWILMPNSIVPEILQPLLIRNGFTKNNFGYILAI